MLLLVGVVLLVLVPSPWNLVAFAACLVGFLGELVFWNRTVRGRRAAAGAETLIGKTGIVVVACSPDGQVRIDGEIWNARCDEGADPGETVHVAGREGLTLVIEPSARS